MANTIRIKRRATGGAAGAPSSLKTSEPAYNEVDSILYLGIGDDGSQNSTSRVPIAGSGAFADLASNQTVGGVKTFSSSPVVPTLTAGDNTTKVASTAFVTTAVGASTTRVQNTVLSGPASGADAIPTYRALVALGIPTITSAKLSDFASGVITQVLTGLSVATSSAIAATDTILIAMGKLQAQITTLTAAALTNTSTIDGGTF